MDWFKVLIVLAVTIIILWVAHLVSDNMLTNGLANKISFDRYSYEVDVLSVYDGDTFRGDIHLGMSICLKNQSIRLNGIDTPELYADSIYLRQLARIARDTLAKRLGNQCLIRISDQSDKYGRIVADVYEPHSYPDSSINDLLVKLGLARRVEYVNH
jgi:micrococcal nuclease